MSLERIVLAATAAALIGLAAIVVGLFIGSRQTIEIGVYLGIPLGIALAGCLVVGLPLAVLERLRESNQPHSTDDATTRHTQSGPR